MRRLSDEAPESESPVIEIRERQWKIRNWLLGVVVVAIAVLAGLIYAGIRVNETREHRNAAASGQAGKLSADLQDALRRVDQQSSDARIAGIATAAAEGRLQEASGRIARLSGSLARLNQEQDQLSTKLVTLQQYGDRLSSENEKLRADLATSSKRIVALQAQRVADSLALAEQNASLNRRLTSVANQTADIDRRVGREKTALRGVGGVAAANLAVGVIHLLGTKQGTDVRPSAASVDK
jgi:DNA anti-recombination protein RmuC